MYKTLEKLQERVLYIDTDSVAYLYRLNKYNPTLGDYVSEFTNELDPGDYITEFISGGPKNYGYMTK